MNNVIGLMGLGLLALALVCAYQRWCMTNLKKRVETLEDFFTTVDTHNGINHAHDHIHYTHHLGGERYRCVVTGCQIRKPHSHAEDFVRGMAFTRSAKK